jgi:hypothetical protein
MQRAWRASTPCAFVLLVIPVATVIQTHSPVRVRRGALIRTTTSRTRRPSRMARKRVSTKAVIGLGVSGRLTDRASAAATWPLGHYLTFLRPKAPASCMRLLGSGPAHSRQPVLVLLGELSSKEPWLSVLWYGAKETPRFSLDGIMNRFCPSITPVQTL